MTDTNELLEHGPRTEAAELSACDTSIIGRPVSRTEMAELYCVGAMMLHAAEYAQDGVRKLAAGDFRNHGPKLVFQSIARVLAESRIPDTPAVFEDLLRSGQRDEFGAGGPAGFLADAVTFCVTGADFGYMAAVVKDLAEKRAMLHAIREAARDLKRDPSLDPNENGQEWTREPARDIAARYARRFGEIADSNSGTELISLHTSCHRLTDRIDEAQRLRQNGAIARRGVTTGLRDVDALIPSLERGELMIVAARPGVGKSAFAGLFALNVARNGGKVLFFSLEMPNEQLTARMLSMTSLCPLAAIRGQRKIEPHEFDAIFEANQKLSQLPLVYSDRRGLTSEAVAAEIRGFARKHGAPALVVVDYLQLLKPENPRDNRNYQIGHATKTLRNVAGEIGSPMLVFAQLNRAIEGRNDLPRLSDLRDSGEVEQDADIVAFLHVDPSTAHKPVQFVTFVVAKQRQGPTGEARLGFTRSIVRFVEETVAM